MPIKKFTEDVSHVSKLSDYPSEQDLSAGALKQCFDRAALQIQDYLNNSLTEEVEANLAELRGQFSWDNEVLTRKNGALTLRGKEMAMTNSFFGRGTDGEFGFFMPQMSSSGVGEQGPKGDTGPQGVPGEDAYVAAQQGGFGGTKQEFNNALAVLPSRMIKQVTAINIGVADWQGSQAPYSYFYAMEGLNADSVLTVNPLIERENILAIGEAMVLAQSAQGGLLFRAFQDKPACTVSFAILREG